MFSINLLPMSTSYDKVDTAISSFSLTITQTQLIHLDILNALLNGGYAFVLSSRKFTCKCNI